MKVNEHGYPSDKTVIVGTLEGWFIQQVSNKEVIFWGDIYGDKLGRFPDGSHIHTSGVVLKGKPKEGDIIETRNNKYKLGRSRLSIIDEGSSAI